jgi:hypothetical protein
MKVKKTLLATLAVALASAAAWALPGPALSHPNGPPSATPNNTDNPGASHRSAAANDALEDAAEHGEHAGKPSKPSHPGSSHKCKPHGVAYIASGTLEAPLPTPTTLTKNGDGTYSGTLTVKIAHTNHHAQGDKSTTKEFKLENVHLTLGIADVSNNGSVGVEDLQVSDQVKLIGKITFLAKKCSRSGFSATTKIRQVVIHPPASA